MSDKKKELGLPVTIELEVTQRKFHMQIYLSLES